MLGNEGEMEMMTLGSLWADEQAAAQLQGPEQQPPPPPQQQQQQQQQQRGSRDGGATQPADIRGKCRSSLDMAHAAHADEASDRENGAADESGDEADGDEAERVPPLFV